LTPAVRKDLDAGRRIYDDISELHDKIESRGNAQNVKAALEIRGVAVESPRPPLLPRAEK
jgi:dihydrodipicolinate synthase/N-acetylneuraminate lyase|tara:strand:+ start:335 stop:514 length:180 start_codon:yes stop_codon:yes gene_type:complete